jgi:hypothetical protein
MTAGGDVEVVGDRDGIRASRSGKLRAAGTEGIEHQHRRRGGGRCEGDLVGFPLPAKLVVHPLPNRPRVRRAQHVLGARLAVAALDQIEVAHTLVVGFRAVALELGTEHLRLREHVLEARGDVQRIVRLADRIGEVARRQGRDDRLGVEGVETIGRQRQRRMLFPERTAEAEAVSLVQFLAFDRREGVPGVEGLVAEAKAGGAAPKTRPACG